MTIIETFFSSLGAGVLSSLFAVGFVMKMIEKFGKEYVKARIEDVFKDKAFRRETVGSAELSFLQKQLEELYGPLYAKLDYLSKINDSMPKSSVPDEVLKEVDDISIKKIDEILWLVGSKTHLIEGADIPTYFAEFTAGLTLLRIGHSHSYSFTAPKVSTSDFKIKVEADTIKLKKRLHTLYQEFGITPEG